MTCLSRASFCRAPEPEERSADQVRKDLERLELIRKKR